MYGTHSGTILAAVFSPNLWILWVICVVVIVGLMFMLGQVIRNFLAALGQILIKKFNRTFSSWFDNEKL